MSVISFKCPNCDGELLFDPATGKYKCEYCMSMFSQKELDAMNPAKSTEGKKTEAEPQQSKSAESKGEQEEAVLYTCPSCGAEVVTDATTAATYCYYCHNPVVLGGRISGKYLPDKIIPFKLDKKEAEKKFLEYVSNKKFVPRAFFDKKQIDMLSGIYFPYWLYDVSMEGHMQAEATKVRVWRVGDEEYTETKFYHVERDGDVDFRNRAENALQKANKTLVQGVLPFELHKSEAFTMGYLSGFQAEKRDIETSAIAGKLKTEMADYGEKIFRETISGYNGVKVKNKAFHIKQETWNYTMLPVWTITYKGGNGKMYYFSLNGQTGKVCGELPIDYKKLTLVSSVAAAVVFVLGLIGGYLL